MTDDVIILSSDDEEANMRPSFSVETAQDEVRFSCLFQLLNLQQQLQSPHLDIVSESQHIIEIGSMYGRRKLKSRKENDKWIDLVY